MTMSKDTERFQNTLGNQPLDINLYGIDAATIRSIQLASGWQDVSDCEFVQFVVGTANSPLTPTKVYPALRYRTQGREVITPLHQVLSFSTQPQSNR
jgi:hypothetical protein